MTTELAQKLDGLNADTFDFTDANAIHSALGYGEGEADDVVTPKGDTIEQEQELAAAAPAAPATAPAAAPAASAPAAPAPAPAPVDSSASPAAAPAATTEVAGVLTKDGKHVIPHAVLQETRRNLSLTQQRADELEQTNQQLQQQIADLKAGKLPTEEVQAFSPEQLAELRDTNPAIAALVDTVQALQAKVAQASPAAPPAAPKPDEVAAQAVTAADEIDLALAPRPILSRYRAAGGVVWNRAVELDAQVAADPTLAHLSTAARFEEVEKRLAQELGIPLSAPAASPAPPAAPAPTAAALAAAAPPAGPATLSDITGTAPGVIPDAWESRSALEGLAAAEKLSDEGLMRMAGLSY